VRLGPLLWPLRCSLDMSVGWECGHACGRGVLRKAPPEREGEPMGREGGMGAQGKCEGGDLMGLWDFKSIPARR
jgi:hypothetical protein